MHQDWDDFHRDVRSAGRFHCDVGRYLRGQGFRDLPAELASKNDIDQRFVVSKQGYVDSTADRDEAGHYTEGHGNSASDALLEIEVLAADTPKGEDQATTDEV